MHELGKIEAFRFTRALHSSGGIPHFKRLFPRMGKSAGLRASLSPSNVVLVREFVQETDAVVGFHALQLPVPYSRLKPPLLRPLPALSSDKQQQQQTIKKEKRKEKQLLRFNFKKAGTEHTQRQTSPESE